MHLNVSGSRFAISTLEVEPTNRTVPPVVPKTRLSRSPIPLVRVHEDLTSGSLHVLDPCGQFSAAKCFGRGIALARVEGPIAACDLSMSRLAAVKSRSPVIRKTDGNRVAQLKVEGVG
jgi:hypothetical protein